MNEKLGVGMSMLPPFGSGKEHELPPPNDAPAGAIANIAMNGPSLGRSPSGSVLLRGSLSARENPPAT